MKRNLGIIFGAILMAVFLLVACRPPELEGLVVRLNQQMYDEETYKLAEDAIQKYPENAEAWYYYGYLQGRKGNFEKMNEAFDKCIALNPQQTVKVEGGGSMTIKDAVKRNRTSYFAENFNAAKSSYDKARNEKDEAKRKELLQSAIDKFTAAHKADPTRTEPLMPLAVSMLMIGDTSGAENQFQQAIKMQPQNEDILQATGDFYLQLDKLDKAEEIYQKALSINPDNANALLGLGQIETKRGNWDTAAEHFEKALELNPENSSIAFNIGVSLYNQEKYEQAIPYLRRTQEAEPDNKELYEILGICYVQSQNYDEGMEFLEDAVQRFPEDAELWNYLAIIYANKGMKDKAEEAMKKTKELEGSM